ncbi:hypothetical protein ACFSJU_07220 [Paradesertivirga mongoliensis]|uniref:Secreted protein n=1 Tax=Paradesertivirga mongoliensis TaxID=2100740 RepID=A0ABW4ZJY5_9SPHI|nr:hypothetical protein [Pedobacter mongoliensis]
MRKFILSFVTAVLILFSASSVNAQYRNALGVRLGDAYGLTYKTFIQSDKALDFILNFRNGRNDNHFILTGLYEVHNPINGAAGLKWYYGAGASIGSLHYKNDNDRDDDVYLSVDGVLGLDYVIPNSPLNLSLDWKPALVLTPYSGFYERGVGLSIRIIL